MGVKAVKLYFKSIMLLISAGFLVLAFLASSAHKTAPEDILWIHFTTLLNPLIFFFNLSILLFWLFKKSSFALIPVTALLFSYSFLLSVFGFGSSSKTEHSGKSLMIASYNVNYFSYNQGTNVPAIARLMASKGVDILALQEFQAHPMFNIDEIVREFDFLPYSSIRLTDSKEIGMAIFSRYPIINSQKVKFEETNNGVLWADIVIKTDTIRVINNHLQTTSFSTANRRRVSQVIDVAGRNFIMRARQARYVRDLSDTSQFPVIVCGDFNDTPQSYVYKTIMGNNLTDGFIESGRGLGGTYSNTMGLVRIDYILHSAFFRSVEYYRVKCDLSDHFPIFSRLEYQSRM